MRTMNQLSLEVYRNEVKPKLTEREQWVLEALEELQPASCEQVAEYLKVPVNVISGRFTGLKKKEKITVAYIQPNNRGNRVSYFKPKESKEYADIR